MAGASHTVLCVCVCVCVRTGSSFSASSSSPGGTNRGKKGLGLRKKPKFSGKCCLQNFLRGLPWSRNHFCVSLFCKVG